MTDDGVGLENEMRDAMLKQLRQNLTSCRRVLTDENLDLKTRERWTQLYNNTSTVLNKILKDRQMRDWERRIREIEEHEKNKTTDQSRAGTSDRLDCIHGSTEQDNPDRAPGWTNST